jgi:hypothetical protein
LSGMEEFVRTGHNQPDLSHLYGFIE